MHYKTCFIVLVLSGRVCNVGGGRALMAVVCTCGLTQTSPLCSLEVIVLSCKSTAGTCKYASALAGTRRSWWCWRQSGRSLGLCLLLLNLSSLHHRRAKTGRMSKCEPAHGPSCHPRPSRRPCSSLVCRCARSRVSSVWCLMFSNNFAFLPRII